MSKGSSEFVEIAVGVLRCEDEVCLSLRQKHQSHSDKWEFPGGKVEAGETVEQALKREFIEELGVDTDNWQALIVIPWHYENVSVRLHVYQTYEFTGRPIGVEGQVVRWFDKSELRALSFPEANQGILTALELPDQMAITGRFDNQDDLREKVSNVFSKGVKCLQLREKSFTDSEFLYYAQVVLPLIHQRQAKLLLNTRKIQILNEVDVDGIQLSSKALFDFESRPIPKDKLLGASVHNCEEIQQALKIDADFLLLSPVLFTQTHPDMKGLGWQAFKELVNACPVPVYALGGMQEQHLRVAKQNGAQGIAAIGTFWTE